ncbi:hypothetical protein OPQ81_001092 [Rhizoctonia solani]|nr:hypothetical protein OPQ81_001092 [Rhizoctonia solani]
MPLPYNFVDSSVKTYSEQLQECADLHKFKLGWKIETKKENGRDIHTLYPTINDVSYPQYTATSNSRQKEAKNEAAGLIINSGTLRTFMGQEAK